MRNYAQPMITFYRTTMKSLSLTLLKLPKEKKEGGRERFMREREIYQ
jgi:hypothetical protein